MTSTKSSPRSSERSAHMSSSAWAGACGVQHRVAERSIGLAVGADEQARARVVDRAPR